MPENRRRINVGFATMAIKETAKSALAALALFLINVWVAARLFSLEYSRHMGSIEAAYVGIARYLQTHWRDMTWFPLWYGGVPYQNTYPPLLHWIVAIVAWARGITPVHAHHWTTALLYCLGPVALFALVLRLSGSRWAALAAGMLYTALSPSAWLVPGIAGDTGSLWHPRRLQALVLYGEGPHVSAMTLLPVAILLLHLAMEKRKPHWTLAAALGLAAVVLTNWLAGFALAMAVLCYLLARVTDLRLRDYRYLALVSLAAYFIAMPWVPPSTIAVTQLNAQTIGGDYRGLYHALPLWGAAIVLSLALLKLVSRKCSTALQFALFFAFLMCLLTLTNAWFHTPIVPQPERYHLEMEMALAMLAALAAYEILKRAPRSAGIAVMAVLALLLVQPMRIGRSYARWMIGGIDITQTSEWKTAGWLNRNWSGERVMLPGSTQFWLTAFSDTPELGGGFAQGVTDDEVRVIDYGLTWGVGGEWPQWSVMWLKAMGVQGVAVSGPGSTEVYKPFRDPQKFEGLLPVLWRDGADVFYQVGKPHRSLARVVPRQSLPPRTPINAADVEPIRAYVAALDDDAMPDAPFTWTTAHTARIATNLAAGQVISWQECYHKGWHASVNGRDVPLTRDALGLMTIDAQVTGPVTVDLNYDGGLEMRLAHWLSAGTLIGLLGWSLLALR
jgi:hypothetical protein